MGKEFDGGPVASFFAVINYAAANGVLATPLLIDLQTEEIGLPIVLYAQVYRRTARSLKLKVYSWRSIEGELFRFCSQCDEMHTRRDEQGLGLIWVKQALLDEFESEVNYMPGEDLCGTTVLYSKWYLNYVRPLGESVQDKFLNSQSSQAHHTINSISEQNAHSQGEAGGGDPPVLPTSTRPPGENETQQAPVGGSNTNVASHLAYP